MNTDLLITQPSTSSVNFLIGQDKSSINDYNLTKFLDFDRRMLQLSHELEYPLVFLPRVKKNKAIKRIGFFVDIRFTSTSAILILLKTAQQLHASISIFNISDKGFPEMDRNYANKHFTNLGLSKIFGHPISLIHLKKTSDVLDIERLLEKNKIELVATLKSRKELLVKLASHYQKSA